MSVNIATTTQQPTLLQRLTGTEPSTVIKETSTTTVTNRSGFSLSNALRFGGIGAAITGALGGVSLLTKISLPLLGKVTSAAGLGRLALMGGAVGVAAAAAPFVLDKAKTSPALKASLIGAGVGAAAGLVLPIIPMWLGAGVGAGVGLLVHAIRNRSTSGYPAMPGYNAYPGYQPYGTSPGASYANGLVPVTPNYSGAYASAGMNGMLPYGSSASTYPGYAPAGYGYGAAQMTLPAQAQGQQQMGVAPQGFAPQGMASQATMPPSVAKPAAAKPAVAAGKTPKGKSFTDGAGNLRQVGTGKILRAAAGASAAMPTTGAMNPSSLAMTAAAGQGSLASPSSYLPGMASALPFQGGSPFTAGSAALSQLGSGYPQAMSGATAAAGAGNSPTLTGLPPTLADSAIPAMPTAVR